MTNMLRLGFSKVIVSAGMPRSGSTLLFNIVRLCLEQRHGQEVVSGWLGDLQKLPQRRVYLLKAHTVSRVMEYRAAEIFYSYRDIRDALVSAGRKFGTQVSIELCRDYVREYTAATRYASHLFRYESLIADATPAIRQVAVCLGIEVNVQRIAADLPDRDRTPSEGNRDYDPTTLLHRGHSTNTESGSWRTSLAPELQRQIHSEFGWWLAELGYPPS
jgi:hypothetical protein